MKVDNKTISRHQTGLWMVRYYEDGKQKTIYGKTQIEVRNKYKAKDTFKKYKIPMVGVTRLDNASERGCQDAPTMIMLSSWLDEWMTRFKKSNLKPSTYVKYERIIKTIQKYFGNVSMENITGPDIKFFLDSITAPRQREHMLNVLKCSMAKAIALGHLKLNPCEDVTMPKHKKKKSKALTVPHQLLFEEKCKTMQSGDIFMFCLKFGLRKGESLGLCFEDFSPTHLSITRTVDEFGNLALPKTYTSIREVPCIDTNGELLKKHTKKSMPK